MTLVFLRAWWARTVRQDSTIAGLATLAIVGTGFATGTMPAAVAVNLAVGAVVAILLPGHEGAQVAAAKAARDVIASLDQSRRIAAIASLQQDLPKAIAAVVQAEQSPA